MGDNKNLRVYSFKGIGESIDDYVAQAEAAQDNKPRALGIRTPFVLDGTFGFLKMHYDYHRLVGDNLRNLILTNHGERLGLHDYGANLRPLTMELNQENFDQECGRRIAAAVSKYMGYVTLTQFQVFNVTENSENFSHVGLRVEYLVPKINQDPKAVEVILLVGG